MVTMLRCYVHYYFCSIIYVTMLRGYDVMLLRVLLFLYYLCYDVTRLRCYAMCIVIYVLLFMLRCYGVTMLHCYVYHYSCIIIHVTMLRGYDVTLLRVLLFMLRCYAVTCIVMLRCYVVTM